MSERAGRASEETGSTGRRPKLRRALLGYRRADVIAALDKRDRELRELRQEVDTIWLALGEHDRALRASGESPAPARTAALEGAGAAGRPTARRRELLAAELADLESAMQAIERATEALAAADPDRGPSSGGEDSPSDQRPRSH